ncbi:MAG: hypothetical protein GY749_47660 [Desulfobacteraceae bacterium]|nr:hypothetical protein [Desulfobacteraceae bacterium]
MFEEFLTDIVSLIKKSGERFDNIEAGVQPNLIYVKNSSLPIETGDKIKRVLPSKIEETFVVTDPGFHAKFSGIEAHYQIKYIKEGDQHNTDKSTNITYNVSGTQSRINIDTIDLSTNISNSSAVKVFSEIREILEKIEDDNKRNKLLSKVDDLQKSYGTNQFVAEYQDFMAIAANHLTVLAPILPALANLIGV